MVGEGQGDGGGCAGGVEGEEADLGWGGEGRVLEEHPVDA